MLKRSQKLEALCTDVKRRYFTVEALQQVFDVKYMRMKRR